LSTVQWFRGWVRFDVRNCILDHLSRGELSVSFVITGGGWFNSKECGDSATVPRIDIQDISIPPDLDGDINGDGIVDVTDAAIMGANWMQTVPPGYYKADLNQDGIIDVEDASIRGAHWQETEPLPIAYSSGYTFTVPNDGDAEVTYLTIMRFYISTSGTTGS